MGKEYRCRLCDKAFPTRPALKAHIREEHSLFRYYSPEIFLIAIVLALVLTAGLAFMPTPPPRPPATATIPITTITVTEQAATTTVISPEMGGMTSITAPTTATTIVEETSVEAPRAPGFQLREYGSGKVVSLEDFEGRPVFLEFFSPFCPHCRNMMPKIEQLYEKYGDRAAFILVSYGEEGLKEVREAYNIRATILVDPDGRVFAEYGVQYVPTFFILDRDHRIVWGKAGELSIEELGSAFENML
jgi:thiol-disulfide isomerase/thioredoxin